MPWWKCCLCHKQGPGSFNEQHTHYMRYHYEQPENHEQKTTDATEDREPGEGSIWGAVRTVRHSG